jgi:hypothetical protein
MNHIRPNFRKLALAAGMLFLASMAVSPATAATIEHFNFTGIVQTSDFVHSDDSTFGGPFVSPFSQGAVLQGTFGFDVNSVNQLQGLSSTTGAYANPITSLTFTLGANSYNDTTPSSPNNSILVMNNVGFGVSIKDQYQMERGISGTSAGSGYNPLDFKIDIIGDANGADRLFNNTSLPTTPPGFDSIGNVNPGVFPTFRVTFYNGTDRLIVSGDLSKMTAAPLPPAVILFGAGLVALIGLGARSWRLKGSEIA